MTGSRASRPAVVVVAFVGVLSTPTLAAANFVWPPALYYYSFTRWWVVVGGLAIEAAVYVSWLRLSLRRALTVSLVTNTVSAAIGFVALWPVLFYEHGIELFVRFSGVTLILAFSAIIIALNICIEYWVAVWWCGLSRTRTVVWNVTVANLLSFALVVLLLPTWFSL